MGGKSRLVKREQAKDIPVSCMRAGSNWSCSSKIIETHGTEKTKQGEERRRGRDRKLVSFL